MLSLSNKLTGRLLFQKLPKGQPTDKQDKWVIKFLLIFIDDTNVWSLMNYEYILVIIH